MSNDAKQKILDLIDRKAFDPVLNASPNHYESENDKKKLKDVQGTTARTKRSYRDTSSADEAGRPLRR